MCDKVLTLSMPDPSKSRIYLCNNVVGLEVGLRTYSQPIPEYLDQAVKWVLIS